MHLNIEVLTSLGWGNFFQSQMSIDDLMETMPFRVMSAHRKELHLFNGQENIVLPIQAKLFHDIEDDHFAVGDWLLLGGGDKSFVRMLDRYSLIKRQSISADRTTQNIASNLNTLFIVTSCNDDFNLSRLERYLAIAYSADITPVIVITKSDLADDADDYYQQAQSLTANVAVELVDAKKMETLSGLLEYCGVGQTVGLVGSSGVGKSTLTNTLCDTQQDTGDIREDDAKGRHTTTSRHLIMMSEGGVLMDTPGMRELGLQDTGDGLAEVFEDIHVIASGCKFNDCNHDQEPGCAVKVALETGELDSRHYENYVKLMAEDARNTATKQERRSKEKGMSKYYKREQNAGRSRKEY